MWYGFTLIFSCYTLKNMAIVSIVRDYLLWHYSAAYADIGGICWNFVWTVNHMFSVPAVLKSLFAPFKRLQEERVNILQRPSDFFGNLFVNIIMRIVGFFVRTTLLAIACILFLIVIGVGVLAFLLWTILPALVIYLFMSGFAQFVP